MQPVPSPTKPDEAVSVHFHASVLETIRAAADSGLKSLPRRGAEVGGILATSSLDPAAPVDEAVLIASEYRYGPGYHLSPRDLGLLRATIADVRERREQRIVGFFRSCTAEPFAFTPNDLNVIREELPNCSLLLIVKPLAQGNSIARIYELREETWHQTAEFPITPARPTARPPKIRPVHKALLALPPQHGSAKKRPRFPLTWIYPLAAALVLLGAIAFLGPRPADNTTLGLNVNPEGDLLRITWNRNSAAVRSGSGGVLRIDEGGQHRDITLTPGQLASGAVLYRSDSRDITFHLAVNGTHGQESIRFVTGAAVSPPSATVPPQAPVEASNTPPRVAPRRTTEDAGVPPVKKPEQRASRVVVPSEPETEAPKTEHAKAEKIEPIKPPAVPVNQQQVPQTTKAPEPVAPASAPSQPAARPPAAETEPWEPMKSVMHYFNDPAVTHPTPVREVRPKPKGDMSSEPVQIRVLVAVDKNGGVAGAQPVDPPASAGEDLINEAVAAARHWKFEPARDHGKKVAATYTITFRFPPDNP